MDLTEPKDIKNKWQEYTEELYKKDLHDPDNHDGMITYACTLLARTQKTHLTERKPGKNSPAVFQVGKEVQFSSVQSLSRVRLCDLMNHSEPGLPVHH